MITNSDCLFQKKPFDIQQFQFFNSEELGSIVGQQSPNGYDENLKNVTWSYQFIDTINLQYATEYNEEPEGGWKQLYLKFLKEDEAAAQFSPEYLGRDDWIKNQWCQCTEIYPLYILKEDNQLRILDGHHRLAGAFYYEIPQIAIILGVPNT